MINSKDFDFSFSGLKTAVLYKLQELKILNRELKIAFCGEFQQAVIDVLISKTIKAAKKYKAKTIMLSGGVAANEELRKQFQERAKKETPNAKCQMPDVKFCTDNAAMIACAAYFNYSSKSEKAVILKNEKDAEKISAEPNLRV